MEKKISLLFGIIGGLFLVLLQLPAFTRTFSFDGMAGALFWQLITLLSFTGLILIIVFSILLIIDTIQTVFKK